MKWYQVRVIATNAIGSTTGTVVDMATTGT